MGICLDTEHTEGSQTFEEGQDTWVQNSPNRDTRNVTTPPDGKFAMHNATNVQFESPRVPVIFVLGGPGSGKVTHCDNLMQEKKGIVHINMTDLLQQYAIGNDMQDFSLLSSKTVTEVLMLEMKMSPNAKTFLVSGYPRNMRDVVEYSEKIQVISGVVLISWRQKVLERQIDYGAKLGQVVLSLARMELNNFYKNVMPVADYFDQSNLLITINGERHPQDVYKDFRSAIFRILGQQDNPPVFANGKVAAAPVDAVKAEFPTMPAVPTLPNNSSVPENDRPKTQVISVSQEQPTYQSPVKNGWPPVLWVIGGPGSNKAVLCDQAAQLVGWTHISIGKLLRSAAEPPDPRYNPETAKLRDCISAGELVPLNFVMKIVESHMGANINANGIILDGFPRDVNQATEFEAKFKQKPTIILLDCSKLQLGRGRLDDSVTAFRRRLEIFRQASLPMLKAMDNIGRLSIVDGDTETVPVIEDFMNVVKDHVQYINNMQHNGESEANTSHAGNGYIPNHVPNGHVPINNNDNDTTTVYDLENEPIETISKNVSNGIRQVTNGFANGHLKAPPMANGFATNTNGVVANNHMRHDARQMYNEINHMDGHI